MSSQQPIRVLTGKKKKKKTYCFKKWFRLTKTFDIFSSLSVGTGAVGAIYSWRLAQTCEVTTVCRSNYDAVKQHGFDIESPKFGNGIFKPHHGNIITNCCSEMKNAYVNFL